MDHGLSSCFCKQSFIEHRATHSCVYYLCCSQHQTWVVASETTRPVHLKSLLSGLCRTCLSGPLVNWGPHWASSLALGGRAEDSFLWERGGFILEYTISLWEQKILEAGPCLLVIEFEFVPQKWEYEAGVFQVLHGSSVQFLVSVFSIKLIAAFQNEGNW